MRATWRALHSGLLRTLDRHEHHATFLHLKNGNPALDGFADIGAVLDYQARPTVASAAKNDVLRALVGQAQAADGAADTALTIVLVALWPGLDAVHGRLLRYYLLDPDRLAADISARIVRGIRRADLTRVTRIASTLLRNLERDLRRDLQRERRHGDHDGLVDDLVGETTSPQHEAVFAADLRQILGDEADIVIAVAIHAEPQRELAERLGLPYECVRKRYQRAIARLRAVYLA